MVYNTNNNNNSYKEKFIFKLPYFGNRVNIINNEGFHGRLVGK